MNRPTTSRGKPLAMFVALLALWIGGRTLTWESPFSVAEALAISGNELLAVASPDATPRRTTEAAAVYSEASSDVPDGTATGMSRRQALPSVSSGSFWHDTAALPVAEAVPNPEPRTAAGHQLMWMAAMAQLPVPDVFDQQVASSAGPGLQQSKPSSKASRWSLDTWAFWRDGSSAALVTKGRSTTYGASQAGAVLNFRLKPSDPRDPRAYARAYRALINDGESELAAGVSARAASQLPLRFHGEVRATKASGGTRIRPAAFVTTEFKPARLPAGLRAEAYAQGGYVGGKDATGFADGQLHILRDLSEFDLDEISIGGAAWGGIQEDVSRVDLGPTVRVDLSIGKTPARLSVDWRERVAGDAAPDSGLAVTLSTRF